MKSCLLISALVLPWLGGLLHGSEPLRQEEPVVISGGRRLPSSLYITRSTFSAENGQPGGCTILLWNGGKEAIRIPLAPTTRTGDPLFSVKMTNEDGAEAVTYLEERRPIVELNGHAALFPALLVIEPRETVHLRVPAFILWETGSYTYHVEMRNTYVSRRVWGVKGGTPTIVEEPIPNVWVGRVIFEGKLAGGSEEPWGEFKVELDRLRAQALNFQLPLSENCAALTRLVEIRHVYATDALIAIEKESRTSRVFHPFVVKALYDITYHGTGYRALPVFAEIALDDNFQPLVRLLCVDVLLTFERSKDLRHDGRVFHIVSVGERETAQKALRKLRARIGQLPAEIAAALDRPEKR